MQPLLNTLRFEHIIGESNRPLLCVFVPYEAFYTTYFNTNRLT